MKHLKWLLIPCTAAILAVVVFVGYLLWQRVDLVNYEAKLVQGLGAAGEGGVTAEWNGVKTVVSMDNCEKLRAFLTVSGKVKVRRTPGTDPNPMTIRMGDRMTVVVENGDESIDEAFFTVQSGTWKRSFRTVGLKSYYWITRTAGEEGYYYPNTVVQ